MKIKKVNELTNWTTYNSSDASNLLNDTFVDYISPLDNSKKSEVEKIKMGRAMLAAWVIKIPVESGNIDKFTHNINTILSDLKGKLNYLKGEFEDMGHQIYINNSSIELTIWSNIN